MGKTRLTLEEVKRICAQHGWKLISTEYLNVQSSLEIMCSEGHVSRKSLSKIREGRQCIHCRGEKQRVDFELVKTKFEELGLLLLTDDYKNAHTPMPVICVNGHQSTKTWHNVRKGRGCNTCGYDNIRGEKNWNYNPNLSLEDRSRRDKSLYLEWRMAVYKRDGYRCQICHTNREIHAHHIYSYHSHPELSNDVDNGITLCEHHHYDFHKKYGFKYNTRAQLDEYLILAKEALVEVENKNKVLEVAK